MENSVEDITKYFKQFQHYSVNDNSAKILWDHIKVNEDKLNKCRNNNLKLIQEFKHIYNADNVKNSTKYIYCQDKLQAILLNKKQLEKEFNNLQIKTSEENKILTVQYEKNINLQIELEEFKLKNLQKEIREEREQYTLKEQALHNDLELVQASTALEVDELETDMWKEIVDLNMRIRQIQKINTNLQEEIDVIKNAKQKKLHFGEQNNNDLQQIGLNLNEENTIYEDKEVAKNKSKSVTPKTKNKVKVLNKLPKSLIKTIVECPETTIRRKKRKLFDPEDITYLENIELKD